MTAHPGRIPPVPKPPVPKPPAPKPPGAAAGSAVAAQADRATPAAWETPAAPSEQPSRYVVGIDLGTTNCAVAYVDTLAAGATGPTPPHSTTIHSATDPAAAPVDAGSAVDRSHAGDGWKVETFAVDQWVDWGLVERRSTLPSFHYQLTADEASSVAAGLPWQATSQPSVPAATEVVGVLARDAGMRRPGRRIASAKSWLSHDTVDRTADILPWQSDPEVNRLSPVQASARYLTHLRDAWNQQHPDHPLDQQDVVITLPASFDEVARELTVAAARAAGLERVYLIEEPQAAFYAWINRHRRDWHERVHAGQMILVCDIGGGTSDFTLIRVRPVSDGEAQVQFHRVAVGRHLILGGDNLDLAIAKAAEAKIMQAEGDQPLSGGDWDRLIQAARLAKEAMMSQQRPDSWTVTLPSSSAQLIGAARSVKMTAEEIDQLLVEGFFPNVAGDARPTSGESGFRELGLPYASDPAITRHLAEFLASHARSGLEATDTSSATRPDWILFNGGVMSAPRLRQRLVDNVAQWCGTDDDWCPQVLDAQQLDLAVAHGAAYYGMVRRGQGVKIAANLGRSYFLQVADQPPETVCLIPGSAQPGDLFSPPQPLQLQLGLPVQFPLWVSSTRLSDQAGDLVPIDPAELSPLPPIRSVLLRGRQKKERQITVRMEAELSEIGTLAVYCVETQSGKRWRLEFDVRSTLHTDREAHLGSGEAQGIVDPETLEACEQLVQNAFARPQTAAGSSRSAPTQTALARAAGTLAAGRAASQSPGAMMKRLRDVVGSDRSQWPPHLLRSVWQTLMEQADGRRLSAAHEVVWLNWCGYCLRPGFGMAVDDWRVSEVWRNLHGKLAFAAAGSRTESLILWRRIAGGLTAGQQEQLVAPVLTQLLATPNNPRAGNRGGRKSAAKQLRLQPHEVAELWRMVGAMERLAVSVKTQLARAAVTLSLMPQSEPYRNALWWAAGRLASRKPLYGPLNKIIPADTAAELTRRLIEHFSAVDSAGKADGDESMLPLALMQIGQRTDDRYRDLPPTARVAIADWLSDQRAPERFAQAILVGGQVSEQDTAGMFGESLPLGLRLNG